MELILIFVVAFLIGFFVAWYIKNQELISAQKLHEMRKSDIDQLEDRFKRVANDVMKEQSGEFKENFELRERNIEKVVKDLNEHIGTFEKQRNTQYGEISEQIKSMIDSGYKIQEATSSLKTALTTSGTVRGRWGETTLKNLLEEQGLSEGIDFLTQKTITDDEKNLFRPDVIVKIPGDMQLAIDSKASLEEYLKAIDEPDEEKKVLHLKKFSQHLRNNVKSLSSKEYQKHLDKKIPYVIMFVPGEAAIRAAFDVDRNLYADAQEKKVMIASPSTIIPLILLISHAWKQHKSVENASRVIEEVVILGERLKTFVSHTLGVRDSLSQATEKFNKMTSSWDKRVYPSIERINDLGGNIGNITSVPQIESDPREPVKLPKKKISKKPKTSE